MAMVASVGTAGGMVTLTYSYAVGVFHLLFPVFVAVFVTAVIHWAVWLAADLQETDSVSSPGAAAEAESVES